MTVCKSQHRHIVPTLQTTWSLSILIALETEATLCLDHNWVWRVQQRAFGSPSVASPQHNNIRHQNRYFIFQAPFQRRETRLVKWLTARQTVTPRWQISARTTETEAFACNGHVDGDGTDVLMDWEDQAPFERPISHRLVYHLRLIRKSKFPPGEANT